MTRTSGRRTAVRTRTPPTPAKARDRIPAEAAQALRDLDDPRRVGEVVEVGPGAYRAPALAQQLAGAVAAYRASRGLTQEQLGHLVALHQSQIARLEAGLHTPELETLVRLARHLEVTFHLAVTADGATLSLADDSSALAAASASS